MMIDSRREDIANDSYLSVQPLRSGRVNQGATTAAPLPGGAARNNGREP